MYVQIRKNFENENLKNNLKKQVWSEKLGDRSKFEILKWLECSARGKPSTWFPREGLVDLSHSYGNQKMVHH